MTNIVDIDHEVNVKLLEDELKDLSVEPPRCLEKAIRCTLFVWRNDPNVIKKLKYQ